MYWRVIPDLVAVYVHTDKPPSDEDFDRSTKEIAEHIKGLKGVLVYAEDVGPSASQRARISQLYKDEGVENIKICIMSNSRMVRGAVTAFSWAMVGSVKAFPTKDFESVADYLELDEGERLRVRVVLKQLARAADTVVEAFADESGKFRRKYRDTDG